jgi:hypothetical protein
VGGDWSSAKKKGRRKLFNENSNLDYIPSSISIQLLDSRRSVVPIRAVRRDLETWSRSC